MLVPLNDVEKDGIFVIRRLPATFSTIMFSIYTKKKVIIFTFQFLRDLWQYWAVGKSACTKLQISRIRRALWTCYERTPEPGAAKVLGGAPLTSACKKSDRGVQRSRLTASLPPGRSQSTSNNGNQTLPAKRARRGTQYATPCSGSSPLTADDHVN